ncbi:MAG: hypothetical protein WDN75_16395 [Bacteroidota bacterium]
MVKDWKAIAELYGSKVARADSYLTFGGPGYSSEFGPDSLGYPKFGPNQPDTVKVRFNLGNINSTPLLELCAYINFNPNIWEQEYIVVGAYIPKGSIFPYQATLVSKPIVKFFSYKSQGIRQEIRQSIYDAYVQLDKVLRA